MSTCCAYAHGGALCICANECFTERCYRRTDPSLACAQIKRCNKMKAKVAGENVRIVESSIIESGLHIMGIVLIIDNQRVVRLNHEQFYQALIDNLGRRIPLDTKSMETVQVFDALNKSEFSKVAQ